MEASSSAVAESDRPEGGKTARGRWKQAISDVREDVRKKEGQDSAEWKDMTNRQKWVQLTNTMTKRMRNGVATFFGVAENSDAEKLMKKKWENRSKLLLTTCRVFGNTVTQPSRGGRPECQLEVGDDRPDQGLLFDEVDSAGSKSKRMQRAEPDAFMARPTVWGLTVDGMKHFMSGKPTTKVAQCRRSFTPQCINNATGPRPILKDDFFEYPFHTTKPPALKVATQDTDFDEPDFGLKAGFRRLGEKTSKVLKNAFVTRRREGDELDRVDGRFQTGLKRMSSDLFENMGNNMDRSAAGIGFVSKWLDMDYDRHHKDPEVLKQLDALETNQHRPFFTYWVTFVQIVIYIFAVAVYGIAPIGVSETQIEAEILKPSLSIETVHYSEPDNLWIGPRQADLIHLGARYSPCMRRDSNVEWAVSEDRLKESKTACCARNDGSGCVQSNEGQCSRTLSTWLKWGVRNATVPAGRTSGTVCGQDPMLCKNPYSLPPFEWPDDISKWPICRETSTAELQKLPSGEAYKHMRCDILGRPCCVGIQGQCIITTREFCEFRRGYFHEEATLCSQISCMNEICGMIPFYNPEKPNQFYRLWTSLFLHAGLFQLLISIAFQWFIMRDLEKLAGWLRIGIIYIMSGIAGSLGSAIFIPYHVEAGPSGSQFGMLACIFAQVIQMWQLFQSPCWNLGKLTMILASLFVVGLLPMIDNWAHLFGFLFGFLLAFALLPYVTFGVMDGRRKLIGIVLCLVTTVGMFLILVLLFYVIPVYKCPNCEYFNCLPFTPTFCKSMEVKITRNDEF